MADQADLQGQVDELRRAFEAGHISRAVFQAALVGLGLDGEQLARTVYHVEMHHPQGIGIGEHAQVTVGAPESATREGLRRSYLNRVLHQTRDLPLAGVDPRAADQAKGEALQLSAVYTALLTQRVEGDTQVALEARRPDRAQRPLSALEMLDREPHLVLLGDPGSGKSTFVDFCALCLAGEGLGASEANLALLTAPLPKEESSPAFLSADERSSEDGEAQPQPWGHGALLPVRVVLRELTARGLPEPGEAASGDTLWSFLVAELGQVLASMPPT